MNRKRILLGAALAAVVATAVLAAPPNDTSSVYKPTYGGAGSVEGVVILQSLNGVNALPINSANPLPVTATLGGGGTVTSNQGTAAATAGAWPTKTCDGTDCQDVTAAGEGEVTLTTALPAGTNNIGDVDVLTLPAIPAGTNNIGDVDVVSAVQPTAWKAPAAATIDASATGQTADFTIEAATASLRVMGWSVREDAGTAAAATVVIRHDADGTCDSSAVVAFIELAADSSQTMNYSDRGLAVPNGLCADVLAGSVSLVAHFIAEAAP